LEENRWDTHSVCTRLTPKANHLTQANVLLQGLRSSSVRAS
jgi:hypothetical protein